MGRLLTMAWRNVWRNWRRTVIAGIAIALGLTFILTFDGFLGGMDEALYSNTVKLQGGHVQLHAPGFREKANRLPLLPLADPNAAVAAVLAQPETIAVSQRIRTGGMVSNREGTLPVVITGLEPEQEAPVNLVAENVVQGRWLHSDDEDVLLIGQEMAERLEVTVGDRVTLVGRTTHEQMRRRTMTIAGIYDLGMGEVEKSLVFVSLLEAQTLFDLRDQATEVAVYLEQVGQEPPVVERLQTALPGYEVDAWDTLDPTTKEMMELEAQVMNMFGIVILMIAGIGILNLMLMVVFERTREIGLLAAMGLKRREIVVLFLMEGVLVGMLGALAGSVLGWGIGAYFGRVGIDWMALYGGMDVGEVSELIGMMGERLYLRIGIGVLVERAQLLRAQNAQRGHAVNLTALEAQVEDAGIALAQAIDAREAYSIILDALDTGVQAAQANLDYLRAWENPYLDEPSERAIAQMQASLELARLDVAQIERQIERQINAAQIRAPFDGTVSEVHVRVGQVVMPGQTLIDLGDLQTLRAVTTDLSERDVVHVAAGQEATVFVEALGTAIPGRVAGIATEATMVGGDVVYEVIIELAEQLSDLRWGMNVEVEIDTD